MRRWTPNGKCPCGGTYEDREVEVRFAAPDESAPLVLTRVPQGACPVCGSRVYPATVLERIEAVFRLGRGDGRVGTRGRSRNGVARSRARGRSPWQIRPRW